MKHWVSLDWNEEKQRLTINGSGSHGTLTSPTRPTRTVIERGANEPSEMFAIRIGQATIAAAKGNDQDPERN
jgi:hypothetical protein